MGTYKVVAVEFSNPFSLSKGQTVEMIVHNSWLDIDFIFYGIFFEIQKLNFSVFPYDYFFPIEKSCRRDVCYTVDGEHNHFWFRDDLTAGNFIITKVLKKEFQMPDIQWKVTLKKIEN